MNLWIKENIATMPQTFLERNIAKKSEVYNEVYEQKQCSMLTFDTLYISRENLFDHKNEISVLVVCFLKNDNYAQPPQKSYRKCTVNNKKLVFDRKIILKNRTCFDELKIILILCESNKIYYYAGNINMCYQLRENCSEDSFLHLTSMNSYQNIEKEFKVQIFYKIFSLKSKDEFHYCFKPKNNEVKGKYKCIFNNKENEIEEYKCIFCFKFFASMMNLNDHINCNHMYFKSVIDANNSLSIFCKEEKELEDNYLVGYVIRNDNNLYIHNLANDQKEYKKVPLVFVNNNYKRRQTKIKVCMEKKIYKDEIMENTVAKKISSDWRDILVESGFANIHNIKDNDKEMMRRWNVFIHKEECLETDFVTIVRKFMASDAEKVLHVKLLIIFYKKALLSQKEVVELLK